jgi:hypothetical protein
MGTFHGLGTSVSGSTKTFDHPWWTGVVLPLILASITTLPPEAVRGTLLLLSVMTAGYAFHNTGFVKRRLSITGVGVLLLVLVAVGVFSFGREMDARHKKSEQTDVLFSQSPLLTPDRKARISGQVISFYKSLTEMGFRTPVETAPARIEPPGFGFGITQMPSSSAAHGAIDFDEQSIEDPMAVITVYGWYAFGRLVADNSQVPEFSNRNLAGLTLGTYFAWDYLQRRNPSLNTSKWADALWEIREKFGRDFTNQSLITAVKEMNRPNHNIYHDFDRYFSWYFGTGELAQNDLASHFFEVDGILRKHGITTIH